jgi:hypothetical protein
MAKSGLGRVVFLSSLAGLVTFLPSTRLAAAQSGDFSKVEPVSFKIMSSDGSRMLGHGEYHLENADGAPVLVGQNRYLDGEYDIERDRVQLHTDGTAPSLLSFEHSFYRADGTRRALGRADLRTGEASCVDYSAGQEGQEQSKQLDFPSDTFAGASAVLALERAMRLGGGEGSFHVFDCAPAPTVIAVAAHADDNAQAWGAYSGGVKQVNVTVDIGWLGSLVGGLIPHREIWLDAAKWEFVGARMQRYFANGPQVMLVREISDQLKVADR